MRRLLLGVTALVCMLLLSACDGCREECECEKRPVRSETTSTYVSYPVNHSKTVKTTCSDGSCQKQK